MKKIWGKWSRASFAFVAVGVLSSAWLGCSTNRVQEGEHNELAYQYAVDQAFADMARLHRQDDKSGRDIASGRTVGDQVKANFGALRGSFKIVVFQKLTSIMEKNSEKAPLLYGKPATFTLTAQRLLNCQQLLKENSSQWNHRVYFPQTIDKSLDCGIFRVVRTVPDVRDSQLQVGDLKETRLYLDSNLRGYGMDLDLFRARRNVTTVKHALDPKQPVSAGLLPIPLDIPSLSLEANVVNGPIPVPNDAYLRNKLRKAGVAGCGSGANFTYRDVYDNPTRVGWCPGSPWPSVVENDRYIAFVSK